MAVIIEGAKDGQICYQNGETYFYSKDYGGWLRIDTINNDQIKHPISKDDLLSYNNRRTQVNLVEKDPRNIAYMKNPDEIVQLMAVRREPHVIAFIKNPTLKTCLEALEKDLGTIYYMDIERYPELYTKYYFMCI